MANVKLRVNGLEFAGWKSARVTRGIESVSGGFELEVSERWANQDKPWQIGEEAECVLLLEDQPVITGYVDRRTLSYSATDHTLSVSGRDKAGALVDCSAVLDKWEFLKVPVLTLAQRVAAPFGVLVYLQSGTSAGAPPAKLSVDPGDTAFEVIERACRTAGLLPVSDGTGRILLTRAGTATATTALIEGQNILTASATFDATARFRTYKVLGQHQGTSDLNGEQAASVKGTASDEGVTRSDRVLVVRPEGNVTAEQAKRRAQWEASVRAARSDVVTVTVQGWTQADGTLWPINALAQIQSPMIGIDGQMLITQAVYDISEGGGTITTLTLKRPDAFKPEAVISKGGGANYWKELVGGV